MLEEGGLHDVLLVAGGYYWRAKTSSKAAKHMTGFLAAGALPTSAAPTAAVVKKLVFELGNDCQQQQPRNGFDVQRTASAAAVRRKYDGDDDIPSMQLLGSRLADLYRRTEQCHGPRSRSVVARVHHLSPLNIFVWRANMCTGRT